MNIEKLSKRLEIVASQIDRGMSLADIGSDHAYLPCYCVLSEICPRAVAGEIAEGPLLSARKQVEKAGLVNAIEVRKGNGLQVIAPGEVDCIAIAGMGGALITEILETGKEKLSGVSRLVLQPNVGAWLIRKWLLENAWELTAEHLVEEDGKIYEILTAERGEPLRPYRDLESELLMGPFLLKERTGVFRSKWIQEYKQWKHILQQLEKAENQADAEEKKQKLIRQMEIVGEALK